MNVATIPKLATTYVDSNAVTISILVSGIIGDIATSISAIEDTEETQHINKYVQV